jgi:glutathione peroxidase
MFHWSIARSLMRAAALLGLALVAGARATAFPAFAMKEKKECVYCHVKPGGDRNFRGLYYKAHANSFKDFDNVYEAKLAGVPPDSKGPEAVPTVSGYPDVDVKVPAALNFTVKDIDGNTVKLARYTGRVILVVNVASKCGNTPQYADLQMLYDKYKKKGFVVLGFPANDFAKQEPGDDKAIKEFCTSKYNVTFPMFSKIVVKGEGQDPFYKFLTDKDTDEKFAGDIDWNFAKFVINRKGEVVARFAAKIKPTTAEVVAVLEKELEEPAPDQKTALLQ